MPFINDELEILAAKSAEYRLIADLATDPLKRDQYEWLAHEMRDLIERAKERRASGTAVLEKPSPSAGLGPPAE